MLIKMIQKERLKGLNKKGIKDGKYVIYWMQASQRTEYNHALEYAISKANELNKPLNERSYYFMLEGLKEVKACVIASYSEAISRRNFLVYLDFSDYKIWSKQKTINKSSNSVFMCKLGRL